MTTTTRYSALFDIETDSLFKPRAVLSIACILPETEEAFSFCDQPGYHGTIQEGCQLLAGAHRLIGHNIIAFDCRHLNRLRNAGLVRERMLDTLTAARLLWPNQLALDQASQTTLPPALWGRHSLEAWGQRLGVHKGTFNAWGRWSPQMQDYCEQDARTTLMLYRHISAGLAAVAPTL